MNSEKFDLEILNYLLRSFKLASYAQLPPTGELGASAFNFIYRPNQREIQLLLFKSDLIHPKDYQRFVNTCGQNIGYEKPYCFLKIEIAENHSYEEAIEYINEGLKKTSELKQRLLQIIEINLKLLAPEFKKINLNFKDFMYVIGKDPTRQEISERLHLLKELMQISFRNECDKWNIPNELVIPEDPVFELYRHFLNSNEPFSRDLFEIWLQSFEAQFSYP